MFMRSGWRPDFKSSASHRQLMYQCVEGRRDCFCPQRKLIQTLPGIFFIFPFPSCPLPASPVLVCRWKETDFSSNFHPIDCRSKALHLLTAFLSFFLSIGQLSCTFWRSPFCQSALVHPCPVHANQTVPQRQDKEKGN